MAKFQFEGVDNLISQYQKLDKDTEQIIGKAIYQGAGVVMKAVKGGLEGIQTDDHYGTSEHPTSGPSSLQKLGLQYALGITKMRNDNGFWNVKIVFDGYNKVKTKRWPQGQPNPLIARSVESGTSWMRKQPFMRRAEQSAKKPCEDAMSQVVDREIDKIMNS